MAIKVTPENQSAVADHNPTNSGSRRMLQYVKRSINAERRSLDAQLNDRNLSIEKTLSDKADRAKAVEYDLMRRQYAEQNKDLMQLSQVISDQKHRLSAAEETIEAAKKKLKQSQSVAVYYKSKTENRKKNRPM
jgi:uncharacterized coiled-coil protein SlyX